ncbi:MAG: ABC transporter ATP-binding protein [Ideonella sp.]|nr:ABC transporter ATP-binding protein [Ideonella sp.]
MALLEIQGLKTHFKTDDGWLHAVDGVDIDVDRGETVCVVGESGCGKSVTAMTVLKLVPMPPGRIAAGRVMWQGRDLVPLAADEMRKVRAKEIAIVFQEPMTSLNPVYTVGEQIAEVLRLHEGLSRKDALDRAVQMLKRVRIPTPERRVQDYPHQFSGGMRQRVMIAIALACNPKLLIADEPTTALDVTIQAQILDLLRELQREQGMGLLLITHDLAVVAGMAHRVALMYAGEIVEVASAEAFFARPRHPYAQALLRALPDAGRRGQALEAIAGSVPPLTQRFTGCRFADRCAFVIERCRAAPPVLLERQGAWVRCVRVDDPELAPSSVEAAAAGVAQQSAQPATAGFATTASTPPPEAPSTHAAQPLLDVRALNVRFAIRGGLLQRTVGWFDAVRDVSFGIAAGRTLALVGESGCGKTTTGKAVAQLLRRVASCSGDARFDGQDLFALQGDALRQVRRSVQLVFQDPFSSLDPRMRVGEILLEGLEALHPQMRDDERRDRVAQLVQRVGLRADVLARYPHEFSGGQRQRIAIARALTVQPRLIICDEPTSALDVSVQAQILNLLRELQRELGVAYLFITHNIGVVEYLAHEVAVMREGRIVEQGAAGEVLTRPRHAYTAELLRAVPRLRKAAP